jgi:hypothetical protein
VADHEEPTEILDCCRRLLVSCNRMLWLWVIDAMPKSRKPVCLIGLFRPFGESVEPLRQDPTPLGENYCLFDAESIREQGGSLEGVSPPYWDHDEELYLHDNMWGFLPIPLLLLTWSLWENRVLDLRGGFIFPILFQRSYGSLRVLSLHNAMGQHDSWRMWIDLLLYSLS